MAARGADGVTWRQRLPPASIVTVVAVLALAGWVSTTGQSGGSEAHHASPSTVESVEGSDAALVTLTAAGAEKIGLRLARVAAVDHEEGRLVVPHVALVQGADGTTWVYATVGNPLQFRRLTVEVGTVEGRRAILTAGPGVGTTVASTGSAQLYGTEFEVGH